VGDNDNDGIPTTDIDDDNDGILDTVECPVGDFRWASPLLSGNTATILQQMV
jgi:hypothetical protein